jgi:DNA-binding response OmpR family regulator
LGPAAQYFLETNALKLFSENINQVVEREQLMKEIYEDKAALS